eukprot:gb/GEZN01005910.1/.p1 GENE.gb/GEZN01005910.1/~~gb/GEZN01005910.1/.p1  ORF type:complete len:468 (+),score=48.47 gb/GEZN01005910.1/:135-1538(+)
MRTRQLGLLLAVGVVVVGVGALRWRWQRKRQNNLPSSVVFPAPEGVIVLFYKYVSIEDVLKEVEWQKQVCARLGLVGRILVASEGINATLSGSASQLQQYFEAMEARPRFRNIDWKLSFDPDHLQRPSFPDLFVRSCREIVSHGLSSLDVQTIQCQGGKHLPPTEFHKALLEAQPGHPSSSALLLDVRNSPEYAVGRFKGATEPGMRVTSDFKRWVQNNQADLQKRDKIFMYCTGGIRCEKASAYLRQQTGVKEIYQLEGGIHRYLEAFPDGGLFQGKNFVFDARVVQSAPADSKDATAVNTVVGSCVLCKTAWEKFSGRAICTVCRERLLICPSCLTRPEHRGEFYCSNHLDFQGAYLCFLESYSQAELQSQLDALNSVIQREEALPRKGSKNKKRTLRKQLARVKERVADLVAGRASVQPWTPKCRGCLTADCSGECWGLYRGPPFYDPQTNAPETGDKSQRMLE